MSWKRRSSSSRLEAILPKGKKAGNIRFANCIWQNSRFVSEDNSARALVSFVMGLCARPTGRKSCLRRKVALGVIEDVIY